MNSSSLRAAAVGAAIAVAAFYAGMTVNRDDEVPPPSVSAVATASPPESPSPTVAPLVERGFPVEVQGERLLLKVLDVGDAEDCTPIGSNDYFPAAYKCQDVAGSRYEPILFYVRLENTSSTAVTVALDRFVLGIADSQSPIDVRSDADSPEAFVQPRQLVPPGGVVSGWLAFDGQSFEDASVEMLTDYYLKSLSYVDGEQTLRVNFIF